MSQNGLAAALDLDRSLVSQYLSGKRQPGNLTCLSFATLASEESRPYWLQLSGLTLKQLGMIGESLGISAPASSASDESQLLDWWRDPKGPVEKSFRDAIEQLLKVRAESK